MTLFGRYMFRQVANAFIVILLTLTIVVWLATALKELNLITSRGQGILLFLQMTLLSLPSLMALIAPNAMEKGLRFAIREGGRTVGAGTVAEIVE